MTPLMLACHRGDQPIVQLLLERKADKNITNHLGKKAVDYAKTDGECVVLFNPLLPCHGCANQTLLAIKGLLA